MTHPFLPSLDDKSIEDLQNSITDLMGKLNFAYRTSNQAMITQLSMVLADYRAESAKRMDEMFRKQNIQTVISVEKDK